MYNTLKSAFDKIQVEQKLIDSTLLAVKTKTDKYIQSRTTKTKRFMLLATSIMAFVVLSFSGFWLNSYFTAYAYISVDINPAIELRINMFGNVLGANPQNKDGLLFMEKHNVKNMQYKDVIALIITDLVADTDIEKEKMYISVYAVDREKENTILGDVKQSVTHARFMSHTTVGAMVIPITKEIKQESDAKNMSPAKYLAYEELTNIDASFKYHDYANISVKDMLDMIKNAQNIDENKMDLLKEYIFEQSFDRYVNIDDFLQNTETSVMETPSTTIMPGSNGKNHHNNNGNN